MKTTGWLLAVVLAIGSFASQVAKASGTETYAVSVKPEINVKESRLEELELTQEEAKLLKKGDHAQSVADLFLRIQNEESDFLVNVEGVRLKSGVLTVEADRNGYQFLKEQSDLVTHVERVIVTTIELPPFPGLPPRDQ